MVVFVHSGLTVTNVVFEYIRTFANVEEMKGLTVTNVVFELVSG